MTRPVPSATATMRILRFLAANPEPVSAERIAIAADLPRSSVYHVLAAMAAESFVIHHVDQGKWGIGVSAWEVGQTFASQNPLIRRSRSPISRLADSVGHATRLALLDGRDVVIVEESGGGGAHLFDGFSRRLPAHLTASGRAILARLASDGLQHLYPTRGLLTRRTDVGPTSLRELRTLLAQVRRDGYAIEQGEVSTGVASAAVALPSSEHRVAVETSWESDREVDVEAIVARLNATAGVIMDRIT